MKKLIALLLACLLLTPALAEGYIDQRLVAEVTGTRLLEEWEGRTSDEVDWLVVDLMLTNWHVDAQSIADKITGKLVFRGAYTFEGTPAFDDDIRAFVEAEKAELAGNFCRGCGYCLPCPMGIQINQCARISLMLRRAPSASWLSEYWQAEMAKVEDCLHCGQCASRCPYELDTPALLERNLEDYRRVLAGEVSVQ